MTQPVEEGEILDDAPVAVPVAATQTLRRLLDHADDVVCVNAPPDFHAVSTWYKDFSQTSDEEVRSLLAGCLSPARDRGE